MALTIRTKDGDVPLRDRIQHAITSSEPSDHPATAEFIDHVWPSLQPLYKDFTRRLHKYVLCKLAEQNLACTITSRVKSMASTAKTLTRREASSKRKGRTTGFTMADIFTEMHDLAGLRIVVQLPGDMEAVQKFVQEAFVAQKPPNVFVTDRKAKDRAWHTWFGAYKTSNYRVSYEETTQTVATGSSRGRILTPHDTGVMFEVQVVSLADSLYGALAHDLLYKEYAGPLSKQDQVVLDLSHGASMCYGLATKYFEEKIKMVQAQTKEAFETASPISPTAPEFPPRLPFANSGRRLYRRSTTQLTFDKTPSLQRALSFPKVINSRTGSFHLQMMRSMRDTVEQLQLLGKEQLVITLQQNQQDQQDQQDHHLQDLEDSCLQSLRNVDNGKGHGYEWYKSQSPKRVQGTCSWFLENDAFHTWLKQGPPSVLLVTADPKCGKTVLARYLVDEYLTAINPDAAVYYFFFQLPDQVSIDYALCAILHQLLSTRRDLLRAHALDAFRSNGPRLTQLTSVLWTILASICKDTTMGPVLIILDGIDQCSPAELEELVAGFTAIAQDSSCGQTKVLLTGRPYSRVTQPVRRFGTALHILGEKQSDTISSDVDLVIQTLVDDLAQERSLSPVLADHIRTLLNKMENYTYFWSHMALDLLVAQHFPQTQRGINNVLQSITHVCADVYESILSHAQDKDMARCVFGLILATERLLTVAEMNVAVHIILAKKNSQTGKDTEDLDLESVEDFEITLRDSCGLFVTVRENHIHFFHPTAQAFLLTDGRASSSTSVSSSLWHQSFSLEEAHGMAAKACADFLKGYFSNGYPDDFLDYALTFGQVHARKGGAVPEGSGATTALVVLPQRQDRDALMLKKRKREAEWKLDWQNINRQWSM